MWIERKMFAPIKKALKIDEKIVILYGPRQVGKTSLLKHLFKDAKYFNCELNNTKNILEQEDPYKAVDYFGDTTLVILDEAQKVRNIGLILKQIIDTFPDRKIIATGSSSFDLAATVNEALTGRALEYSLMPLSVLELKEANGKYETMERLEEFLIYGLYPEIVLVKQARKEKLLTTLADQYLYKDVLEFERLKKSGLLMKLLELLALQIGQEVSLNELATNLQVNRLTVERYLHLLEASFIIFPMRAYAKNPRVEVTKKRKYYFWDLGIRNAVLNKFQSLRLRDDTGALWENFLVVERRKALSFRERTVKKYFWRSLAQNEIDYLEERDGILKAYEFKWSKQGLKSQKTFFELYPEAILKEINRDNMWKFLEADF